MQRLRSRAVATDGNRWQMGRASNRLKHAARLTRLNKNLRRAVPVDGSYLHRVGSRRADGAFIEQSGRGGADRLGPKDPHRERRFPAFHRKLAPLEVAEFGARSGMGRLADQRLTRAREQRQPRRDVDRRRRAR